MTLASILFAIAFNLAALVLVGGLVYRVVDYARTPAPLKIPTTPAPTTRSGVVLRMLQEVTLFSSLFRANKWTWLLGMAFHAGLLLVLLRHLRYFTEPVWAPIVLLQTVGIYAGMVMVAGLAGLWLRRFTVDRVRYISNPSDHLWLAVLIAIAGSGLAMKFIAHTDIVAVKAFFLGLLSLSWQPLPPDPVLYLHLTLVLALMVLFPYSKLLHAPGVFFSPTRNQVDNPREKRHLAPWASRLEKR